MRHVQTHANDSPPSKQSRLDRRCLLIQSENPDGGVVKAVEHARAGSEVVRFLGDAKVPGVKDHAEDPTGHPERAHQNVVGTERVVARDGVADLPQAVLVREEVEEGEEDGEWFLDAEKAVEWPFSMELDDGIEHRWVARQAPVGDDLLTCVVAFGRACPEEESEVEGWKMVSDDVLPMQRCADAYVELSSLFCNFPPCTPVIVNWAFPKQMGILVPTSTQSRKS